MATTNNVENSILLPTENKSHKCTFSIDIFKFLNTVRKRDNLSWTYKCAKINS